MKIQAQFDGAIPKAAGSAPGVLLSIATLFRRPLFLDPDAARAVARSQGTPAIWERSRCMAWVLLPDRWQGLVDLAEGDSLDRLVRRFKALSARAVDPRFRVNGWLWARGFEERALQVGEDMQVLARHMVAQPVRAGLAKSVASYPYWDAVWLDASVQQPGKTSDLPPGSAANTMAG